MASNYNCVLLRSFIAQCVQCWKKCHIKSIVVKVKLSVLKSVNERDFYSFRPQSAFIIQCTCILKLNNMALTPAAISPMTYDLITLTQIMFLTRLFTIFFEN